MAFDPLFKFTLQDEAGNYYTATQNGDATWTILTIGSLVGDAYLKVLPNGWDKTSITYERDMNFMGIFRSASLQSLYQFSLDGRAIIQSIFKAQDIQGYGLLTIWMWNESTFDYDVFYKSELDFTTYKDDQLNQFLEVGTLDSGLIRDIHARADTPFNVPIFTYDTGLSQWLTDAKFLIHDGIKLLYSASFIADNTVNNFELVDGGHWSFPSLNEYDYTQNNGSTTFIGNDILQKFLINGQQSVVANTSGFNNYSNSNYALKCILPKVANVMWRVSGNITKIEYINPAFGVTDKKLAFEIFEIDDTDTLTAQYQKEIVLPHDPSVSVGSLVNWAYGLYDNISLAPIPLNFNHVYVCGFKYIDATFSGEVIKIQYNNLQNTFFSAYDSGTSGVPISAPILPPSVFPAFHLYQLLEKIVPYLATTNTDGYGFPTPIATPFTGVSDFLSNESLPAVKDIVPYQLLWTSAYCIHDLEGQSYITLSLNNLFNFCKKILGCGASIEYDTFGNPTKFRIEDLAYFFDPSTMILDLGSDVTALEITTLNEGRSANLKLGYTKIPTNEDFGCDGFNTELYFNTPLKNIPGDMDYEYGEALTEMNAIEKIRAQYVSQPIGTSYNPTSPSSDNQNVVFYCLPVQTQDLPGTIGGNPDYPDLIVYDPSNTVLPVLAYQLTQRNGVNLPAAQSTDNTAAANPYIYGLFYPDTAFNVELSPCRILQRDSGAYLHSVLNQMDAEYLTFRNTSIMQYNNTVLALSGIESNLVVGSGAGNVTTEFKDILIGDLPDQLFKPIIFKVRSKYPVNLYQLLNTNPNGYVRFLWQEDGFATKEYKGFIAKAMQVAGNSEPTDFYLWAHPDTVL